MHWKKSLVQAAAPLHKWEKGSFVQKLPENDSPNISPGKCQFASAKNPKKSCVYKIFTVL